MSAQGGAKRGRAWSGTRVLVGQGTDERRQLARLLDEVREPELGKPTPEMHLVVVDRLSVATQPRYEHGTLPLAKGEQGGACAGVSHDDPRL